MNDAFRLEVRAWLEEHCPLSMRQAPRDPSEFVHGGRRETITDPDARLWLERMAGRGWTAPTWPVAYGGAGLSGAEARLLADELRRINARPPLVAPQGLLMLGPALLQFGSQELKAAHLRPIARGEVRWCQGFSEPDAGSDLAALSTRAAREGDTYVVNGQKIWTSNALEADWIFALVRTDPVAPKRDGISFLLIDMASPGITVRPIVMLSGRSEFCEVFFEDVRVPVDQLVGQEHRGWPIARFILAQERSVFADGSSGVTDGGKKAELVTLARRLLDAPDGRLPDHDLRDRITRSEFDRRCTSAALAHSLRRGRTDRTAALHPSVIKYVFSESFRRRADLRFRLGGSAALGWSGETFEPDDLRLGRDYLDSKVLTIAGGTSEIQLNTIARRVLGLPHLGPEEA